MTPFHFPLTPDWLWWAHPWFLLGLLALPLLVWLQQRRDRRPVIRYSGLAALRAAGGGRTARWRVLLPVLRLAALACLIVACARPVRPDETSRIFAEGVAIELVVDVSGSMEDTDLSPGPRRIMSRLDVVKQVIEAFVRGADSEALPGRPDDLIGLIRFARYADSVCPLTLDHDNLLGMVGDLDVVRIQAEDGTAIGAGLGLAVERMRDLKRTVGSGEQLKIKSRIIILLTDGENNVFDITPREAGELAATQGVKVYTILAGTGRRAGFVRQPVDDRELRYIAEVTGGRHFRARDPQSLAQVYAEIDALERTRVEERRFLRYGELALPWLAAAFACLGLQMFFDATWLRRIP